MQLEIGSILDGKVTGITNFGAFVELPGGETGMVHISEVALQFVNQIKDFLSEGQEVKVKVIGILKDGKISLSIKQTKQEASVPGLGSGGKPLKYEQDSRFNGKIQLNNMDRDRNFPLRRAPKATTFEDMISKFKQTSEEKISDLKKVTASKYSGSKRGKRR
ncbi:MAG: S1 RNA-binding domain-containing protein [Oscillospiraceae bacterium]|jgi:S1 RNA binding domain protein|nr:S1 RNA-binding domain-containing protein [Oscillospiraceae bacterium]